MATNFSQFIKNFAFFLLDFYQKVLINLDAHRKQLIIIYFISMFRVKTPDPATLTLTPHLWAPRKTGVFQALAQAGAVDTYRSPGGALLLALDGTEYFSSQAIHCEHCSARRHANGKMTYFHAVLTLPAFSKSVFRVFSLARAA
jgi:hypothetical protein